MPQRGLAAAPALQDEALKAVLQQFEGAYPEYHVGRQLRLLLNQAAHHVGADHLLVYRVGLDVFVVEPDTCRRR